jgi:hypothetical protein
MRLRGRGPRKKGKYPYSYYTAGLSFSSDLNILNINVELKGQDPFRQIRSGHLKVRRKVSTGIIRKIPHQLRKVHVGLNLCHGCLEVQVIGEYIPDCPGLADTLHNFECRLPNDDGKTAQRKLHFLLLANGLTCGRQ